MLNKKRTFRCIYPNEAYMDFHKVEYGTKAKQNDLKDFGNRETTVRKCPGFFLAKPTGFVVYQPFDFKVQVHSTGKADVETSDTVTVHPAFQHGNFYKNYVALKVVNHVYIKESTGVKCSYVPPFTENMKLTNDVIVPAGVVDFKYNNGINLFYMVRIPDTGSKIYEFKIGEPAVKLLPLCERWELKHEVNPSFDPVNHVIGDYRHNRYNLIRKVLNRKSK